MKRRKVSKNSTPSVSKYFRCSTTRNADVTVTQEDEESETQCHDIHERGN